MCSSRVLLAVVAFVLLATGCGSREESTAWDPDAAGSAELALPEAEPADAEDDGNAAACGAYENTLQSVARNESLETQAQLVRTWLESFGPDVAVAPLIDRLDTAVAALDQVGWRSSAVDGDVFFGLVEAFYGIPDSALVGAVYPRDLVHMCDPTPLPPDEAYPAVLTCVLGMEQLLQAQLTNASPDAVMDALQTDAASPLCDDVVIWLGPQLSEPQLRDIYSELPADLAAQFGVTAAP